ncbi:hypothetical protein LJ707_12605 [Mucilaginibacter sp. UR6-1]|uniref:hypothetical protein n=1 Tax=Mucilaginibacter sp. UR6-1 TaxID=1435643 RepID=UPI001E39626C|nr:hypothetical protein [Mucilaginibacter sp. UR6-1]MCC8409772.1 hypothetical protein [Mucilaginibacter sp. UR6-1]
MDSDQIHYRYFNKLNNNTLYVQSLRLDPDLNIDTQLRSKFDELAAEHHLQADEIGMESVDDPSTVS